VGRVERGAGGQLAKKGLLLFEVSVSDTGVDIAPEDQEAVFEEFRQVGTADKKMEGTGRANRGVGSLSSCTGRAGPAKRRTRE